ncbi:polysaccharide biosynthesis tyrosine autokinase [Arthrobacter sp. FW306-07-I]|uniref:polysaccharide biosynthesis tyrosine autokinase n=1 Tax=Arthrobacter sp. FW306-07-I TaxID=2879622 RepID=UPI001F013F5B|nr:polysaccharide biosynthesis tyrosine autokinase [Arthrobacter sp. FW306-07-I]UKA74597.1 polysaccharide biosynthesis tyrosine autokinase [Arthrobacter sp. FW306-07-I]
MELKDYLRIIRRNWILVVACSLIGILGAGAVSLLMKPSYRSETKLFVALQNSGSVSELQQGNVFSQARVQSYVKTVTTPTVLQPVIDSLDLKTTPQSLAQKIVATSDINTVLISISVQNESPVQAAAIAQSVSRSLIAAVDDLEKPSNGGASPVKLSIVTPATAPASPYSPNVQMNLIVGLLAGLATGIGLAVLRALLDTRIRGEADLRRVTNSAVLGGISFDADAIKKPLLTQAAHQSPRAESFRQLRTNLQFAHVSHESKTLLVTSSVPGEGKSTTATNLAIAMAQAGQSVALVDADLRRPMIAEYLGLERNAGLTTALIGKADVDDLLQSWGDGKLYVLASGQIPPNPSELLGSEKMKQLIIRLESVFDTVIIDAPPLLPVTDAAVLAQQVGGVVVVVGTQKVRTGDLEKSFAALEMVQADLLGVVLNRLPLKGPDAYAYNSYSYSTSPRPTIKPSANVNYKSSEDSDDVFTDEILHGSAREATRFTSGRGQGA